MKSLSLYITEAIHNKDEYKKICDMQSDLTKNDVKYLKKYCYSDYSMKLNSKLRNNEPLSDKDNDVVSYLDKLISTHSLPIDLKVNRYISLNNLFNLLGIDKIPINDIDFSTIKQLKPDNAFMSCSLNNGLFYRDRLKIVITIKKGATCLVPHNYIEDEVLLPRNAQLLLTDYLISSKGNSKYVTLYCDYY